ncbi:MAG: heavy metal translocating P-type ATPase [Candidatus Eisenbacteria bacterium]
MKKIAFKIHGMDCADEITVLKRAVGPLVGGEENLDFDLVEGKMTAAVPAGSKLGGAVQEAVARAGMEAVPWDEFTAARSASEGDGFRARHGRSVACVLSGVLLACGFATDWAGRGDLLAVIGAGRRAVESVPLPAVALYLLSAIAGAWHIAPRAVRAARRVRADMNLLMMIAVIGAMAIGEWFEAAAVTFLFSLALLLESWSVERARRAIRALLEITPGAANVLDPETGRVEPMPVEAVRVGATVLVRPGDRIPLDGVLTRGTTSVNQAPITGESLPVAKSEGDEVFAGTINGEGAIEFRSTKEAKDTTVARIIRMVEEARARRAPSEQWVERFARIYTPAMMGLSLFVALFPPLFFGGEWSRSIYQALVLLVIACPCALVISTPVSVVAALASSAKHGVLVKGGRFLEVVARLRALAIDKTGTLTEGRPAVSAVVPAKGHTEKELLEIVAAIEARSEHPLARAVVRHAESLGIRPAPAEEYRAVRGKGAGAVLGGRPVWVGSHRYLEERGHEDAEVREKLASLGAGGSSVIVAGTDDHVCGFIALADSVRPRAREAIAALRAAGIRPIVMLTGDNRGTAEAVGRETGVDDVRAELLPEDKLGAVEDLVREHGTVGMLGDGVNDAPAMARASVGIAMGAAGSDAAIETADVALMSDDLLRLPWLVRHSRRMLSIVKQNVAASIAVKGAFVALTFAGYPSLWAAIGADMGISLLVVFNALRLLRVDPDALPGMAAA